jgi:SAM-dependent methyltransferase
MARLPLSIRTAARSALVVQTRRGRSLSLPQIRLPPAIPPREDPPVTNAGSPKDLVRRGYDRLSYLYRGDAEEPENYHRWLDGLRERLPAGGSVVDLGCGCGVPVARKLVEHGYAVTGVDISEVQISRARELVPGAVFVCADATTVEFDPRSWDAVVSLYALIHIPQDEQLALLDRIGGWLRPGGWLLATTGVHAWSGTEEGWLGGDATMYWSHADAATYRAWITQAGLTIEAEEYVPEGDSGHQLFWASKT